MLNSVLQAVKPIVNGLVLPGQVKPLTAQVVPPPVEPLAGPMGYITPGPMQGKRGTAPRGPGFTHPNWMIDITLDLLDLPTDPNLEQAFPLVVDAVLTALWAVKMPVKLTDPTTGVVTQMRAIAEDYEFTPADWRTTAQNRAILFRGRIGFNVREATQTGPYMDTGG